MKPPYLTRGSWVEGAWSLGSRSGLGLSGFRVRGLGHIGIMEKRMETTILLLGLYTDYAGIMENNMETTTAQPCVKKSY